MSQETELIRRYFDAFNRQDLEGVMPCFGDDAVIVGPDGSRSEGAAEIRKAYAASFKAIPDGKCVPRTLLGADGAGAVESIFTGIKAKTQEAEQTRHTAEPHSHAIEDTKRRQNIPRSRQNPGILRVLLVS